MKVLITRMDEIGIKSRDVNTTYDQLQTIDTEKQKNVPIVKCKKSFYWDSNENRVAYTMHDFVYALYDDTLIPLCSLDRYNGMDQDYFIDYTRQVNFAYMLSEQAQKDHLKAVAERKERKRLRDIAREERERDIARAEQEKHKSIMENVRKCYLEGGKIVDGENIVDFLKENGVSLPPRTVGALRKCYNLRVGYRQDKKEYRIDHYCVRGKVSCRIYYINQLLNDVVNGVDGEKEENCCTEEELAHLFGN